MTTSTDVVHFLLERGLLSPAAVVDQGVQVADASRRSRNVKVSFGQGSGFFVKQPKDGDPQALVGLDTEAVCYWLARSDPAYAALAAVVPVYVTYEPLRHLLVVELLAAAENLPHHQARTGTCPPQVAAAFGAALAACHTRVRPPVAATASGVFAGTVPWFVLAPESNGLQHPSVSAANAMLLQYLREHAPLREGFARLRQSWQRSALIHGDVRFENVLLDGDRIRLVDWELADAGDPCWDVGGALHGFLAAILLATAATPAPVPDVALLPLAPVQPALRAFWEAYAATAGLGAGADGFLLRSIACCAVRVVQTAYEYHSSSAELTPLALHLLGASQQLLADPGRAAAALVGGQAAPW